MIAITPSIEVLHTSAPWLRITAKTDFPEYGVKSGDVVYLVRTPEDDGKYAIVRWSYESICWCCPCKGAYTSECAHTQVATDACKARKSRMDLVLAVALNALGAAIKAVQEKQVKEGKKTTVKKTRIPRKNISEAPLQQRGAFVLPKSYKQIEEEQAARLQSHYVEKLTA